MIYSVDVRVSAPVQPTEVEERVAAAVERLFPNADVERHGDRVTAETHEVEGFRERLFDQQILDTARGEFLSNADGEGFDFELKKQAAFEGVVNFAVGGESELGDIHVDVTVNEPSVEEFITYLAPETVDGKPTSE
ncbi:RNA-binding domain-containing protein [Halocalculus aciditolerans]|uniref:UPF0201 protein GCM10009039_00520 n=1 Tax=Halocalculus aciditolerans TaxID=1383812 RepID=A0A830F1J3_9EURY|nr:RNA-binding domain-containing protein [Halocalculus aciditolerans]GGL46055.1 hypothetical protein GCM10009039_00520 [Halocalculus aciditolerans]